MRSFLVPAIAVLGVYLMPASVRADLAPPVPPVKEVKFVVEVDEKAKAPKLIVPQNLTTVRVRPRPLPPGKDKNGNEQLTYIEVESGDEPATQQPATNRTHMVITGVALALAISLGGLWLVTRHGKAASRGLAILIAVTATLGVTSLVLANAAPPPPPPQPPRERMILPIAFDGKVNLEVTVGGDTIRLVLDKETYDKLKEKPKEPERK